MDGLTVAAAQMSVLESVKLLGTERIKLEQSLGRVLAEDIRACRDLPPYDVSAMDGFAVRSADLISVPLTLEVIEDIKAGDIPNRTVQQGQCSRIMTGAPVPVGADAVIRMEDTQTVSEMLVRMNFAVRSGNDIRPQGESMRDGEVIFEAGIEITSGVIGVLATAKARQFSVFRRPKVAILSTGNELEDIDDPVDLRKIPDSNSYALLAQVQTLGIEPVLLGIARDDPTVLEHYLRKGLEYDVLLVSGGTSVGVHDYVRPTIEKLGVQMKFWRVAMKPGHPMAFGTTSKTAVFGLPGNPVSSMVCFEEFVGPALRCMMGHTRLYRRTVNARLARDVRHSHKRVEFVRVELTRDEAGYIVSSTGTQSSGVLLSMAKADGLLVVPPDCPGLEAGQQVTVQLLDGTEFQEQAGF